LERGIDPATPAGLAWAWPTRVAPWLTADGRAGVADLVRAHAHEQAPTSPGAHAQQTVLRSGGRSVTALTDLHGALGLRVHAPFLDDTVVRAALSTPGWARRSPHVFKPLLGVAMRGAVPDVVLDRRSKGTLTPTMLRGIRHNLPVLRELVLDGVLAAEGLVDAHAVAADLQRAADGNARAPLAPLNQALALEVWARTLDTDPTTWWEECR
jgi:asparagine synthase (glutamine-hydrolysing)